VNRKEGASFESSRKKEDFKTYTPKVASNLLVIFCFAFTPKIQPLILILPKKRKKFCPTALAPMSLDPYEKINKSFL
jgi:hypothetical protein